MLRADTFSKAPVHPGVMSCVGTPWVRPWGARWSGCCCSELFGDGGDVWQDGGCLQLSRRVAGVPSSVPAWAEAAAELVVGRCVVWVRSVSQCYVVFGSESG